MCPFKSKSIITIRSSSKIIISISFPPSSPPLPLIKQQRFIKNAILFEKEENSKFERKKLKGIKSTNTTNQILRERKKKKKIKSSFTPTNRFTRKTSNSGNLGSATRGCSRRVVWNHFIGEMSVRGQSGGKAEVVIRHTSRCGRIVKYRVARQSLKVACANVDAPAVNIGRCAGMHANVRKYWSARMQLCVFKTRPRMEENTRGPSVARKC